METHFISQELKKIGFRDKEIKIYLTSLEIGPASVQTIARKARLVRPTTYEVIRILKEKGVFDEYKENDRRVFIAQPPAKILHLLRVQKRELAEREREFVRIVAALESHYYSGERGEVSVFHEEEGVRMLEERISFTSTPEILVLAWQADAEEMSQRKELYEKIRSRLGKTQVKELYAENVEESTFPYGERKSIEMAHVVPGTLFLFDQAVFFPAEKTKGYVIENQLMVELFKSFFHALWPRA